MRAPVLLRIASLVVLLAGFLVISAQRRTPQVLPSPSVEVTERVAVAETRLVQVQAVVEQHSTQMTAVLQELALTRGVAIGFGSSLGVLQVLQLLLELRRRAG